MTIQVHLLETTDIIALASKELCIHGTVPTPKKLYDLITIWHAEHLEEFEKDSRMCTHINTGNALKYIRDHHPEVLTN